MDSRTQVCSAREGSAITAHTFLSPAARELQVIHKRNEPTHFARRCGQKCPRSTVR